MAEQGENPNRIIRRRSRGSLQTACCPKVFARILMKILNIMDNSTKCRESAKIRIQHHTELILIRFLRLARLKMQEEYYNNMKQSHVIAVSPIAAPHVVMELIQGRLSARSIKRLARQAGVNRILAESNASVNNLFKTVLWEILEKSLQSKQTSKTKCRRIRVIDVERGMKELHHLTGQ